VVEFLDVPQEPPAIIENHRVPAYWPSSSESNSLLVVKDLEVKYAPDLPSVIRGVSFSLNAGERVGILGRTGCGKSTLVSIEPWTVMWNVVDRPTHFCQGNESSQVRGTLQREGDNRRDRYYKHWNL
jgi:ABC-type glutathione transport system ATPase component